MPATSTQESHVSKAAVTVQTGQSAAPTPAAPTPAKAAAEDGQEGISAGGAAQQPAGAKTGARVRPPPAFEQGPRGFFGADFEALFPSEAPAERQPEAAACAGEDASSRSTPAALVASSDVGDAQVCNHDC